MTRKTALSVEEDRLLHPAGLGEHEPAPEAGVLGIVGVEERVAHLLADAPQEPAVHGVAPERPGLLGQDLGLARHRPAGRQTDEDDVHGPPADVDDQGQALAVQAQAVAEGRRHRLVEESEPPHPEAAQDLLQLRPIGLEGRDRRGDHQVADAVAGGALDLVEQLAQEGPGRVPRGHPAAADASQGPQRLVGQRGLEGGDEGGVGGVAVALEGRAADEGGVTQEEPARQRAPGAQPVEESRVLEHVDRRGHEAGRLEGIGALGTAADRGQLHQLGLPRSLVPAGDAGVGGPEIEGPAAHGPHPTSDRRSGKRRWAHPGANRPDPAQPLLVSARGAAGYGRSSGPGPAGGRPRRPARSGPHDRRRARGVALLGVIDHVTGPQVGVSIIYLAPIGVVAWLAGRGPGLFVSVVAAVVWGVIDRQAGVGASHPLIPVWNALVRLGFFAITAWLIADVRHMHARERLLARSDPLTGVANARAFLEALDHELARMRRTGEATHPGLRRPRPFQGGQRHPGPRRRGHAAARGRLEPHRQPAGGRRGGASRGRRVRPAPARHRLGGGGRGPRALPRGRASRDPEDARHPRQGLGHHRGDRVPAGAPVGRGGRSGRPTTACTRRSERDATSSPWAARTGRARSPGRRGRRSDQTFDGSGCSQGAR